MELEQEQDSLQTITEIDPLNVAEILGNVGGFWGETRRSDKVNSTGLREMPPIVFILPVVRMSFVRLHRRLRMLER